MGRCFVMQRFDGGVFDEWYEDLIAPTIKKAGLEPYRVDKDPNVSIPIQEIESGIRGAAVCVADISLDNPNVWFELGFAIAENKEAILLCSDSRQTKFLFYIQHRSIIKYKTGPPRDLEILKEKMIGRLTAIIEKGNALERATDFSKIEKVSGLDAIEIFTLASICDDLYSTDDGVSVGAIRRDMERAGFTGVAAIIALRSLTKWDFMQPIEARDFKGDIFTAYQFTTMGWEWVLQNKERFALKKTDKKYQLDDDPPF